jgi:hypothetical protein
MARNSSMMKDDQARIFFEERIILWKSFLPGFDLSLFYEAAAATLVTASVFASKG